MSRDETRWRISPFREKALLVLVSLWAIFLSVDFCRAADYCEICKKMLRNDAYLLTDHYHNKRRLVCKACSQETTRCVVCEQPVPPEIGLRLPDGRAYCAEDAKTAVMSEESARNLFTKARQEATELLTAYPPLADRNIEIHLVTREEFNRQYRKTPGIDDPSRLLGLTISRRADEGKLEHDIYLLHGLPEEEFLAVCAHEYTHTWLHEREKKTRQLHKDTAEGVCEFIAYKVVEKLGFEREEQRILDSTYTHGQVIALIAAEKEYSFYRLVRWITDGVDSWLNSDELPRLLVLREVAEEARVSFPWIAEKPSPVPDKLVLKGLSGPANRRFALINNATLSMGEQTRVRIAASNLLVRCLSITSNAVTIQVQGEAGPRQLKLEVK
jgi:hypothetical protein